MVNKSLSVAVLCLFYGKTAAADLPLSTNLIKQKDNSFLDTDVGQKMS